MAKPNIRKKAEILYMLFADALYSARPEETVEQVRNRLYHGVNDEERAALESLIMERRVSYASTQEAEMPAAE